MYTSRVPQPARPEVHTRGEVPRRVSRPAACRGCSPLIRRETSTSPTGTATRWRPTRLQGKLLREWGRKGTGDGEFQLPGSIALGPDGLLYVPDQGNSRVQKFTREGKFVGKWGEHGKEPGQFGGGQAAGGRFAGPQFVAFDRAGNVYTTDAALDRVQKFTPEGKLLAFWGTESAEPGGFGPPPREQGRHAGHGRPHRAVRGPAGPGLGQRHEQPRPAVHERRGSTCAAWEGRAPSPAASTCRTGWRWTAATACTSRIR